MKLIDGLIEELVSISNEYNRDNDKEIINLKLDLLINQVKNISLNMDEAPLKSLDGFVKAKFNQLLYKHKVKAIQGLKMLKEADSKRKYNHKARKLTESKLYFPRLHKTMTKNIESYTHVNRLQYVTKSQIFKQVEREGVKHEQ